MEQLIRRIVQQRNGFAIIFFLFVLTLLILVSLWSKKPVEKEHYYNLEAVKELVHLPFGLVHFNDVCLLRIPIVLILVMSNPENFEQRTAIRKTWGHRHLHFGVVFFIGSPSDGEMEELLTIESNTYRDIIQAEVIDNDDFLPLKQLMAFYYATTQCVDTQYILKVDDGVYVNTGILYTLLDKDVRKFNRENILMCNVFSEDIQGALVGQPNDKKVTVTYCDDKIMLFSKDVVIRIYKRAVYDLQYPEFQLNNIYYTGILLKDIYKISIKVILLWDSDLQDFFKNDENPPETIFLAAGPENNPEEMMKLHIFAVTKARPRHVMKL